MASTLLSGTACPAFCNGLHPETYRVHSRDVATLVNEFSGEVVDVELKQYPTNDGPVISLALSDGHEETITQLRPNVAVALSDCLLALGEGGTLVDALREASDLLDDALDYPGIAVVEDDEQ